MDRKKTIEEAEALMNEMCKDCFVYKQFRRDFGRRQAHKFCISQCTVGEKLKQIGERLGG